MTEHREIENEIARKLACVEILRKKLATLEAEPGIVMFETTPFSGTVCDTKQVLIQHGRIDPFLNVAVYGAVSRKPIVAYQGVEVAREVYRERDEGQPCIGERNYLYWLTLNAKPGNLIAIIDTGGGRE